MLVLFTLRSVNHIPNFNKVLISSLSLAGNSGRLTWVIKAHQPQEQRYNHSYQSVRDLCVSKQWFGCQFWGFLAYAQMFDACDCTRRLYGHRKRVCAES